MRVEKRLFLGHRFRVNFVLYFLDRVIGLG